MRVHTCKTKHWELCKCTDRLIRRYFIKTVHFVYTDRSHLWKTVYQINKQIKLFTFDYHESKSQRTVVTNVLLDQRLILRWSSPFSGSAYFWKWFWPEKKNYLVIWEIYELFKWSCLNVLTSMFLACLTN